MADVRYLVPQIAAQEGADPALLMRVVNAESGGRSDARSPKGAIGPAQLMPGTARDLGVDPNDPVQNLRGGARYLKQQLDTFGDPALALAAYNAGPNAVRKAGGIPQNGETPAYVGKTMPKGSDDIFGFSGSSAPAGPGRSSDDIFDSYTPSEPAPAPAPVQPSPQPMPVPQRQPPNVVAEMASDAASGFMGPIDKLVRDVKANYAKTTARMKGPPSGIPQVAAQAVGDLGDTAGIASDVMGLVSAPLQALLNPVAGALSRHGPQAYGAPQASLTNGKLTFSGAKPLSQPAAQAQLLSDLNTAASAAMPSTGKIPIAPKPVSVEQLRQAKDAAYQAVDASGFRFPNADVQKLSGDVTAYVARKGGPKAAQLYPGADAVAARLDALANQPGGVPLTQLDELRSDVYGALVAPGDREAPVGRWMRQKIDDLIAAHNTPDIAKARDLNTRLMKAEAVAQKLDSADLRAASTYSGGNYPNAVRQSLRPLVDTDSAQRIGNLTPQEDAALRRVVKGTPGQNAIRYVTKILTNKIVQAPVSFMTMGTGPAAMEAVGTILNKTAQNQTNSAVQKVLDLISMGGRPAPPQPLPILQLAGQPPIAPLSPRGLFGLGVLAQPTRQVPSARAGQKPKQ